MSSTGMSICSQQLHWNRFSIFALSPWTWSTILIYTYLADGTSPDFKDAPRHSPYGTARHYSPAAHGVTGQVFAWIDLSERCAFQITLITLIHWVSQGKEMCQEHQPPRALRFGLGPVFIGFSCFSCRGSRTCHGVWPERSAASATKLRKGAKWTSVSLPPWWVQAASSGWDIQSLLRWPFVSASESKKNHVPLFMEKEYKEYCMCDDRYQQPGNPTYPRCVRLLLFLLPFPSLLALMLVNLQQLLYGCFKLSMNISENRATPKLSRAKLQILW